MECIEEAERLKKLVESVRLHREEGRPKAIYDAKGQPNHSEARILSKFANRLEYLWHVRLTPVLIILSSFFLAALSLLVISFETSLYL